MSFFKINYGTKKDSYDLLLFHNNPINESDFVVDVHKILNDKLNSLIIENEIANTGTFDWVAFSESNFVEKGYQIIKSSSAILKYFLEVDDRLSFDISFSSVTTNEVITLFEFCLLDENDPDYFSSSYFTHETKDRNDFNEDISNFVSLNPFISNSNELQYLAAIESNMRLLEYEIVNMINYNIECDANYKAIPKQWEAILGNSLCKKLELIGYLRKTTINNPLKLTKSKPNLEECKILFSTILNTDYLCFSDNLNAKLCELNKDIVSLESEDIVLIEKGFFYDNLEVYNLENDINEKSLPIKYTYLCGVATSNDLFCFSITDYDQYFDLYNNYGTKLYEKARLLDLHDNYIIFIQDHDLEQYLYKYDSECRELNLITKLDKKTLFGEFKYSENRLYIENGYVNHHLQPSSPFCFDKGKEYKECLAAVCLNGKWGYINTEGEIIIDFQYGAANSFENGIAEVLLLKPEYRHKKGHWVEVESFNEKLNHPKDWFDSKFPNFPKTIKKPLAIIRGNNDLSTTELIETYNCFSGHAFDDISCEDGKKYGTWITIDQEGNQIAKNIEDVVIESNPNDINIPIENEAIKYDFWLSKIKTNPLLILSLPDDLFVDKIFVLDAVQQDHNSFQYFSLFYDNDDEVCSKAFAINPIENYPHFSERLKSYYLQEYNTKTKEESDKVHKTRDESNFNNGDDLPF